MGEVHILTGPERRRRWSEEDKRALIATAFAPGAIVRDVARRADICTSLIYRWRRERCGESPGFAEMVVVPSAPAEERASPAVEVVFGTKARARIPTSTTPALAAAIVKALAGG